MAVTYTDEQIKTVCDKAAAVLAGNTDAQNVTFPSTAIIEGMKAGLTAEEVAVKARETIDNLPQYNNGFLNTMGFGDDLFNYKSFLYGTVKTEIEKLGTSNGNGQGLTEEEENGDGNS